MNVPKAKDIALNAPVAVTLPALVWLGFLASYQSADWVCQYTSAVASKAQEQLMDPLWLKEQIAKATDHTGRAHEVIARMLDSESPDQPPDPRDDAP